MLVFKLIISIGLPLLAGYQMILFLLGNRRLSLLAEIPLSLGLGLGVLSHCMLLLGAFGVELNMLSVSTGLIVFQLIVAAGSLIRHRQIMYSPRGHLLIERREPPLQDKSSILIWALMSAFYLFVGISVFIIFWDAWSIPVYTWDSLATSVYNAKIIYFDRSLAHFRYFAHPSFPLHVPLILDWICLNLGRWDDQFVKIIFPLIFMSFVAFFGFCLRLFTGRKGALLGTFLLFSSNLIVFHAATAYRDIFLMYYNCVTVMLLMLWGEHREDALLSLAAIFAGFATFVKQEGVAYYPIYAILVLFILYRKEEEPLKDKARHFLRFLIPSLSIFSIFLFYKISMNVPLSGLAEPVTGQLLARSFYILQRFGNDLFVPAHYNIVWALLAAVLILHRRKIMKDINAQILVLSLCLFLGLHFLFALFSSKGPDIIAPYTLPRLFMHFFPLAVFTVVYLNGFSGKQSSS